MARDLDNGRFLAELDELSNALEHAMLRERYVLPKQLARLRRSTLGQAEKQQRLTALRQRVGRSRELVAARLAHEFRISYPRDLPIAQSVDELRACIERHQVVVIVGATGSGKSTQLPKLCLELGRGIHGRIGHTQPRRIAARGIAARLSQELQADAGELVGYKIRFDDRVSERTRVKLMSDGILLQELTSDRLLLEYDTIIVDEVHERSLNIDLILGYLKKILTKRPDLRVLLTSATIDAAKLAAHFSNAPILEIPGKQFPVAIHYEDDRFPDDERERSVVRRLSRAVKHLLGEGAGDVLIFLPGEREIFEALDLLRRKLGTSVSLFPLYGRLTASAQARLFEKSATGVPRVILATNIAETSITLPDIRYVIDSGLARIRRYNPRRKLQQLPVESISKASAAQRAGRCGRVGPGICFRMYSEREFLRWPAQTPPEIERTNLAGLVLRLKMLGLGEVEKFPFLDSPNSRFIKDGRHLLQELNALDQDGELTAVGRQMARFPVEPRLARLLSAGAALDCLSECLIIASGLSIRDPRERPPKAKQRASQAHHRFTDKRSDFGWFLNAWPVCLEALAKGDKQAADFCRRHFLSLQRVREWRDVHRQLRHFARDAGLKNNRTKGTYKALHQAIIASFLSQIGRWDGDVYQACRHTSFIAHPNSVMAKRSARWVVAAEVVETGQRYARYCARIDPRWIENVAKDVIRYDYVAPSWDQKHGRTEAFAERRLYGLILGEARRVPYDPIDREASRRIFIDEALLDGAIGQPLDFLEHNQGVIAAISVLEAKARRRDILASRSTLHAFYAARLPEHVSTRRALLRWLNEEPARHDMLKMTTGNATEIGIESVREYLFPDTLEVAGSALSLHYVFAPDADDDGLTIDIPTVLLPRIDEAAFDRLVPGFLQEKITAMLRGLPKTLRRQISPLNEYAMACVEAVEEYSGALSEALALALNRMLGLDLNATDFSPQLPPHLRMRFRVIGGDGQVLATGRNFDALAERLLEKSLPAQREIKWPVPATRSRKWEFGELAEHVYGDWHGVAIRGYPGLALVDGGVEVAVFAKRETRQRAHFEAVLELVINACTSERRALTQYLNERQLPLHALKIGFRRDIVLAITQRIAKRVIRDNGVPERPGEYDELVASLKAVLYANGVATGERLVEFYQAGARIGEQLKALGGNVPRACREDLNAQLELLSKQRFIVDAPEVLVDEYRRYFKALEIRLRRLDEAPAKDLAKVDVIKPLRERVNSLFADQTVAEGLGFEMLLELEEVRVQLFAPEIGMKRKISPTRLAARLDEIATRG
ncbi:MAG: ATP-dependent RNA helicase HrpA [Pseudomonadota bacterium]